MTRMLPVEIILQNLLCRHPELIDDSLYGISEGMCLPDYPTLKREDLMPNGRRADMVFVEKSRITVVELKKVDLKVLQSSQPGEDVLDQILDYLRGVREKYPGRVHYRGFVVGTRISNRASLAEKIAQSGEQIVPLVFGRDIPADIRICSRCSRALPYDALNCPCGVRSR